MLQELRSKLKFKFTKLYWQSGFSERWHAKRRLDGLDDIIDFSAHVIPKIRDSVYETVIEIGTGSGLLSYHLSQQLDNKKFIGIDINRKSIRQNNKSFKKNNLTYETAEILNYIKNKNLKNAIFIAYNTLSYFEMKDLEKLFNQLTTNIESVILITNGEKNTESISIQKENANLKIYRHNFKKLLNDAGFDRIEINEIERIPYLYFGYYNKVKN